jgi:hypothetical protein
MLIQFRSQERIHGLIDLFRYDHPEHIFEEAWRETQYRYAEDRVFIDLPGYTLPISRWTTVSNDDKLLSHLLMLFWTWDTICSGVIDRTIFEEDLKSLDPSSPSSSPPDMLLFCSPFLVNALLAVSCVSYTRTIRHAYTIILAKQTFSYIQRTKRPSTCRVTQTREARLLP